MINFVICDDDKEFCSKIKNIINKYMLKTFHEYKIHVYNDYDEKFNKFILEKLPFKVYILDIETPNGSGIDAARKIRKNDLDSIIIFLTGHEELGLTILKNEFYVLTFINKFDNYEDRLNSSISKSLQIMNKKSIIRVKERSTTYTFNLSNIVYIYKNGFERKTIIVTDYGEYKIGLSLKQIKDMLDNRFIQTHRSCYVNNERVVKIDKKSKSIVFDNSLEIDLLSDVYERG